MQFYLGTPEDSWLKRTKVPLFVSARRLRRRKALPVAVGPWALDSGSFTELALHGWQTVPAMTYSTEVRIWARVIGNMEWAAPQDWMCEPHMIQKTGLSVREHQRMTVANYLLLRQLAPDLPWVPVLQGWEFADYLRCVEMYGERGVDLAAMPLVGLGSVCRRQDTGMVEELIAELSSRGMRLHGFGFKVQGLRRCAAMLASADSMAWSLDARRGEPLKGCKHAKCANCIYYAMRWRVRVLGVIHAAGRGRQLSLFA